MIADFLSGHVAGHILKRGVEYLSQEPNSADADQAQVNTPQDIIKQVPTWGVVVFLTTIVVFGLLLASVRYTLGCVVTTLAMVESPSAALYVETPQDGVAEKEFSEKGGLLKDTELLVVKQQPLTSKIRMIIYHLHKVAGFRARWRGLALAIVNAFATGALTFTAAPILSRPFASIYARVTLALLATTWTHIVISMPSAKPWYRRVPSYKVWRKVLPATTLFAVASKVTMYLPLGVAYALGLTRDMTNPDHSQTLHSCLPHTLVGKVLTVIAVALFTFVAVYIPAQVTLIRVQASLLPEEDEGIVPFDRTFGGKVVPEAAGGSGVLGVVDAWKSFDRSSRLRLLKLYGKIFAVTAVLHILMIQALICEAYIILGEEKMFGIVRSMRS